ncbi:MAG: hypothetical protein AAGD23_11235 [Pseudomonadota bacterium]
MRPITAAFGITTRKPATRPEADGIANAARASFNSHTGRIEGPMALVF